MFDINSLIEDSFRPLVRRLPDDGYTGPKRNAPHFLETDTRGLAAAWNGRWCAAAGKWAVRTVIRIDAAAEHLPCALLPLQLHAGRNLVSLARGDHVSASASCWTDPPAGRVSDVRRRAYGAPSWRRRRRPARPSARTPV
jgi:hypothetical protein